MIKSLILVLSLFSFVAMAEEPAPATQGDMGGEHMEQTAPKRAPAKKKSSKKKGGKKKGKKKHDGM